MKISLVGAVLVACAATRDEQLLKTLPTDIDGKPLALPENERLDAELLANIQDHEKEVAAACEHFHCGQANGAGASAADFDVYRMSSVPSIDFPSSFVGKDAIHVSKAPLFSEKEVMRSCSFAS